MALIYSQFLILLVVASMFAISHADTIIVGGSENWRSGFNYTGWAIDHGPFFINDKLVFRYAPPRNSRFAHNVYLLPNLWSFITCDFRRARLLANSNRGGNDFSFVLSTWRVYYFASGSGYDCRDGMMKFFAVPWPRRFAN